MESNKKEFQGDAAGSGPRDPLQVLASEGSGLSATPAIAPPLRPAVQWFAEQMEAALRRKDHRSGWVGCNDTWLRRRMLEEMDELAEAMLTNNGEVGTGSSRVIKEAADVANFCMMIADNAGPCIGHVREAAQGIEVESAVPVIRHSPKNNEEQSEDAALPDGRNEPDKSPCRNCYTNVAKGQGDVIWQHERRGMNPYSCACDCHDKPTPPII